MSRWLLAAGALGCVLVFPQFAQAQVTTSLLPVPRQQFFTESGVPLSGGLVYTYISGTNTPQATYTDSSGTIQNTNPVVLDSGGQASIWLASGVSYTITVTDQKNSQQWSVNGVTGPPNLLAPGPIGTGTPNTVEATQFLSASAIPALTGLIRLASGDQICWRNNANNADACLSKNASDSLLFNGTGFPTASTMNTWTATQTFNLPAIFNQTTGSPPFTVASTTNVPNLNASSLNGSTFPSPGAIGSTSPGSGVFTTLQANINFILNGSQALTGTQGNGVKLQAAGLNSNLTGALLCNDSSGTGNSTTSGCSTGAQGPYNRSTSLIGTAIAAGAPTSVMSTTVVIPSTGGPYRIHVSYTQFIQSNNTFNGIDAWISDGSNTWGYFQQDDVGPGGQNNAIQCVCQSDFSFATYAAGAGTITLTLIMQGTHSGSTWTAQSAAVVGPGFPYLAAEVIASN